ncbi:DNA-binding protein [Acaryochloris sp. 'Moss Beach']|uniref:FitA-like ribbon-helix-helix domain-containing protein n=1 Tax=Acaryochloris TaxID=155977 RepID=UPI001BB0D211|nr:MULTISPECIES: DNA-binding protein [Acaryochloris]QUY41045.1 DNA-binding protein [Acaryochloris marina S15]UJB70216.1 DNA-binding protein [Acaryochloris sp. 'Moss Beach']
MANLIVRNIDDSIVRALKMRASQNGVSAEAEHRKILEQVLFHPPQKSFSEVLCQIPQVGCDEDFERIQDDLAQDVFD